MSFERTHARGGGQGAAASDAAMATPGKRTQVQLLEQNAELAQNGKKNDRETPTLAEVRAGDARLKFGDHGPAVAKVQRMLHIRADGEFDDDTRFAVEKFQHKHDLPTNGIVGRKTLRAIERAHKQKDRRRDDDRQGDDKRDDDEPIITGGGEG
jgi:murein L,D-transpeptidase YcbB/YkuD